MHLTWLWVAIGIAVALWLLAVALLFAVGKAGAARELVGLIPNLLLLFKDLVRDPQVPRGAKVWLVVAPVWLASPIDLLPEFLPVVGPLDDAIVAAAVLRHLVRTAGPDVVVGHWRGDPATIERILRPLRRPTRRPADEPAPRRWHRSSQQHANERPAAHGSLTHDQADRRSQIADRSPGTSASWKAVQLERDRRIDRVSSTRA